MLFYLIIVVTCLVGLWIGQKEGWWCVVPVGFAGLIVLMLVCGVGWGAIIDINGTPTRTEAWSVDLVSLRNGPQHISGTFFLASGSFGSKEMYVYMYRTPNGDIRRGRENAYRCTIRETDKGTPRRVYDKRFKRVSWLIPWEVQLRDSMPAFVVPPGTIISLDKYEID